MMRVKNRYVTVGFGLAGSWVFSLFCFFVSGQDAPDWFARSGAVLCLMAAVANFTLVRIHQRDLAKIFRDKESSRSGKAERILKPPETYITLARISYLTGFLGTAIWGYGDLLF